MYMYMHVLLVKAFFEYSWYTYLSVHLFLYSARYRQKICLRINPS